MRGLLGLCLVISLMAVACGGEPTSDEPSSTEGQPSPRSVAVFAVHGVVGDERSGELVDAVERRLSELGIDGSVEIGVGAGEVSVFFADGIDPRQAAEEVMAGYVASFHPVLAVHPASPYAAHERESGSGPASVPAGLDPVTGLSVAHVINGEMWLDDTGGLVYQIGPAFLASADITGASVNETQGHSVVDIDFSEAGAERFRDATAVLSTFSYGDPRRQLAIVVNSELVSAPAISADVPPGEALDPDVVVITMGSGGDSRSEAESLAEQILSAHYLSLLTLRSTVDSR